ncbi:hypothetical protein Goarm_009821 [Gossypium armourianum]|uniref:Uncharacterized protein n=1 Tax=Gossypium armourianum TaxID=34283 RepID=A0A7J9JU09_9ROSI|nr:hypothetical protein [Gossypium armourianum]
MLDLRQGPLTEWTWDFKPSVSPYYYGLLNLERNDCECANKNKCFDSILRTINGFRSLTICRWFFETSMCKKLPFSSRDPLFCLRKLKELWWIDCSMERESINALLCFLKLCPNLERLYITIDPKCYDMPSTAKFSTLVIVPGKLNDLKTVKLEGFADEEKEIFMARRLLPLFGDNNPIIISKSKGEYLKHLVKVAKLEKKGKYPYKFKAVENVDENFSDHLSGEKNGSFFSTKCVNVRLDEKNYLIWKQQVLFTICGHSLEDFFDSSTFPPSKFIIVIESGKPIPNEAYTLFAKQDCALASWILSTMSLDILTQLVGAKTSASIWSTLTQLFLYLSTTKVMHLHCKLRSLRKGTLFMRDYFSKIKEPTSQGPQPLSTLFPNHVLFIPIVAEAEPLIACSANFVAEWDIL